MPEEKKTKYDLLQDQIVLLGEKLSAFETQWNQIKESIPLLDHFKDILKNFPIDNINERINILEKNINDRGIEMGIYEKLDILTNRINKMEKDNKPVNPGISPTDYFKGEDKDPHFIRGNTLVNHEGIAQKRVERPIIEPVTIQYL